MSEKVPTFHTGTWNKSQFVITLAWSPVSSHIPRILLSTCFTIMGKVPNKVCVISDCHVKQQDTNQLNQVLFITALAEILAKFNLAVSFKN